MNEFLDKLADLMEEYNVCIYNFGAPDLEIEFCGNDSCVGANFYELDSGAIRALKTKEDATENK